jgi:hypothetical protein
MDTKYVQMMRSFSEHPKCYKRLSLMKEMRSTKYIMALVGNSMDILVVPWLCNPLEAAQ